MLMKLTPGRLSFIDDFIEETQLAYLFQTEKSNNYFHVNRSLIIQSCKNVENVVENFSFKSKFYTYSRCLWLIPITNFNEITRLPRQNIYLTL
jgi:hypothetical protein